MAVALIPHPPPPMFRYTLGAGFSLVGVVGNKGIGPLEFDFWSGDGVSGGLCFTVPVDDARPTLLVRSLTHCCWCCVLCDCVCY